MWLIPITVSEVNYKKQNGLEALEQKNLMKPILIIWIRIGKVLFEILQNNII